MIRKSENGGVTEAKMEGECEELKDRKRVCGELKIRVFRNRRKRDHFREIARLEL